ncbi:MAG: diguanylate cyclase, partial [Actinomycetota bacterium]
MALAPEPSSPGSDEEPALRLLELTRASSTLKGAFDHGPVGLFLLDPDGGVRWCNTRWRTQLDVRGAVPIPLEDWLHRCAPDVAADVMAGLRRVVDGGSTLDIVISAVPGSSLRLLARRADPAERRAGVVAAVTEVPLAGPGAASHDDADAWAHQALHDPLTDLPNRLLFGDHLVKALARCERDGSRVALLYFDVDRFKAVNDTQGHEAGDVLLGLLARRLTAVLRPSDTVARYMAASASRRRVSPAMPGRERATPAETVTGSSISGRANGSASIASVTRRPPTTASCSSSTWSKSTTNSSPPSRATVSLGR